jgi:hypothetical protein
MMHSEELMSLKARRIMLGAEIACAITAQTLAKITSDAVESLIASATVEYICGEVAKIEAALKGL